MTTAIFLSEQDRDLVVGALQAIRSGRVNFGARPDTDLSFTRSEDHQAPEVYVAKLVSDDIPAASDTEPGDGTCDIYQILIVDGTPIITQVEGLNKTVYNISSQPIAGDQWIVLKRTKYGRWLASQGCC